MKKEEEGECYVQFVLLTTKSADLHRKKKLKREEGCLLLLQFIATPIKTSTRAYHEARKRGRE